jgi:hypothetical protein
MVATSACPDVQQLQRLLLGELPQDETQTLEEHLSGCSFCLETVRGFTFEDALVEAVRYRPALPDRAEDEAVRRLIERLKGLGQAGGVPAEVPGTRTRPRELNPRVCVPTLAPTPLVRAEPGFVTRIRRERSAPSRLSGWGPVRLQTARDKRAWPSRYSQCLRVDVFAVSEGGAQGGAMA